MSAQNLTDNSPMPWGKYQGTKMANVPAQYLLNILDQNLCNAPVKKYILENKEVLEKEVNETKSKY
jgi:uncharacterized protein (DUF3820 family)